MASSEKRKRSDIEDANALIINGVNTIYVKTYTGETFSLQVKGSDTIISVKFKIADKIHHLPHDKQALIFNDMVLEDVITLADYRVKKNSTLTLMRKPSGLVPIFINDLDKKRRWPVNVKLSDTIGNLKKQINDKAEIPVDNQVLIFNEMVLHDSGTLADFHIKTESTLTLMRKSTGSLQIFVQPPFSWKFSVEVNPLHTIASLKAMVSEEEGISTQELRLLFNKRYLEDSHTFADYNIQKDDVIHAVFNLEWRLGNGLKI